MNDPRRPERFSPPLPGSGPAGPQGSPYPPPADPAYADQAGPYAPTYGGGYGPQWASSLNDTKQLPPYWQRELPPSGEMPPEGAAPPPPGGRKSPRWLFIGAGLAVLLAVALVIALVLVNNAIKTQTVVPPLPAMPGSSEETPTPTPSTRTTPPSHTLRPVPPPTASGTPPQTTGPVEMQDVVYNVTGDGRALSIVYIGTGDMLQTEFNVALPWSKEVSLSKSAAHPANVTVVNFGHNVTCSVTIAGVEVSQRVGVGLTVCDARG